MKKILLYSIFVLTIIIIMGGVVLVSPYYYYSKIIKENYTSSWYSLIGRQKNINIPSKEIVADFSKLGNDDLWQKFHFMDVVLPLPVKNPFFFVSPVLKYSKETTQTEFGLKLYGGDEREIAKIYFMTNRIFPSEINAQRFFQLPLVKKQLKATAKTKIWKDIFTLPINEWNIPFADMAYNLYILHLRAKILPEQFQSFSMVKGTETAIIEMESINKDYTTEILLTNKDGVIYSFVLLTEKNNNESQLVRYKLLKEVEFRSGSHYLANILYKEFKGLTYQEQVDHTGMLMLLSAWTHDMNQKEYIREMIESLEKGERNQRQLEALYAYAAERYGTTFTTRNIDGLRVNDNILLQRKVELENLKEIRDLKNKKEEVKEIILSPEEKLKLMLEKAKRNKKSRKGRMIID